MRGKGIVLVPPAARSNGPWLDATRATSLQRVANRPIVCHVLDALAAAGVLDVVLLAPADLIEDVARCARNEGPDDVSVSNLAYDHDSDPGEVLEALARLAGDGPTLVHRADGTLAQPLTPFLELVEAEQLDMVLLVAQGSRNAEPLQPAVQHALRVAELDPSKMALGIAGVCVLGAGALGGLEGVATSSRGFELASLAESAMARDHSRVQVRVVRDWRAFAGDAVDLLDMNRVLLDALEDYPHALQTDGNRFEGHVFVDPSATVRSSVVCGPVIVGAGAYVADSYIGPHTSIGERVRMEGVEIERSIVLAGASIMHVGGRLITSVVGREARVFRDFSMPRALRLQVGDGDEVALC